MTAGRRRSSRTAPVAIRSRRAHWGRHEELRARIEVDADEHEDPEVRRLWWAAVQQALNDA